MPPEVEEHGLLVAVGHLVVHDQVLVAQPEGDPKVKVVGVHRVGLLVRAQAKYQPILRLRVQL